MLSTTFKGFVPTPSRPVALLFGMFLRSSMTCCVLINALGSAIVLTIWFRMLLYIVIVSIFDFTCALNWSLKHIRCIISLFIQGDKHLICLTLFLILAMCWFITSLKINYSQMSSFSLASSNSSSRAQGAISRW